MLRLVGGMRGEFTWLVRVPVTQGGGGFESRRSRQYHESS
jgi:hypothetical protein